MVDANAFWYCLNACYCDKLSVPISDRCIVSLVLAIGAEMDPRRRAPPKEQTRGRPKTFSGRDSVLFLRAKAITDRASETGDIGFWLVQALGLQTYYHLLQSRRNIADVCLRKTPSCSFRSAKLTGMQAEPLELAWRWACIENN